MGDNDLSTDLYSIIKFMLRPSIVNIFPCNFCHVMIEAYLAMVVFCK